MRSIVILMASICKPRIRGDAIISLGTKFLDRESPTSQDWRVLASHLGFLDTWIQKIESVCLPTGKSPTVNVLRAWQERFPVTEALPVHEQLVECLRRRMIRIDAASWVEQKMENGTFLDPQCRWVPRSCYFCQTGQHTSQTNDSTRSKKSAQENSYYGLDHSFPPQCDCESIMNHQPHPRNLQSVVSLYKETENLPTPSHWNNNKTWPLKKGEVRGEIQHHFHPRERESPSYHQQLSQDDDGRPFHSLVSTTSEDGHRHCGDDSVRATYGPCSHGTVDSMMMDNPTRASPNQTLKRDSVLITYAYKNFKTAHNLASLMKDRGHDVKVDTREPIEYSTFISVTFVIIIYTQEYFKEVSGIKQSSLHTRLIWDLMAKEYNCRGNLRFVPIFDYERIDRTSIPDFLRNYPKEMAKYICNILTPKHGEISIQRKVY